ncbi:MAG: hypothetical protein WDZ94_00730 [Patescibacteria group bacterium]
MKSIAISIILATIVFGGITGYWVYATQAQQVLLTKHAAVQGCITVLPEVNPGWYNKCMAEKGYQTNLTY